jgi:DNA-binding NarL/FixJ family response regulator
MMISGSKPVESPVEGVSPFERLLRDLKKQAETIALLEKDVTEHLEKYRAELPAGPPDVQIPAPGVHLSRREKQTLVALLAGCSEKQVARHLGLSKNTVHIYVKALHRKHDVASRGELLSRYLSPRLFETLRQAEAATEHGPAIGDAEPPPIVEPYSHAA